KPTILDLERAKLYNFSIKEIDLNILQPQALRQYAEMSLGNPISDEFAELLLRTTNGNPFYLEQLIEYFQESGLLVKEGGRWHIHDQSIKLSNSIQSILTARIDRLSALVRETVKAAAVIGREFEVPVLSEVMKSQQLFAEEEGTNVNTLLQEQIRVAERSQIWQAMTELRYIFKHSLLREAVYDMQLRTRLRQLHRHIAMAIEKVYADQIDQHLVDLAFHYEHAEQWDKTKDYLQKAGDHARRNFQNQRAIDFYDKLIGLLQDRKDSIARFRVLLKKGKILELIGQWEACRKVYNQALTIAQELNDKILLGRSNNCLGHLLLLQGHYRDARLYLEIAANFFEASEDQIGISKVYGDLGNLYFRQGKYNEAKANFTKSIEINEAMDGSPNNTQIVANLGLTHMNQGNYDEGINWLRRHLEPSRLHNDKQSMAVLYTNMGIVFFEKGDYDSAGDALEKGMHLAEELGNKQLSSIAIGCLGSVFERKGYYQKAMENFQKDLQLAEELGDQQGTAIALGLIGDLCSVMGQFDAAIEYLQRTLTISRTLGYKKGIAKAVNTLGDIYYFKGEYQRSLAYYNQAIEVTREINNRLVLGSSLYEKGLVLVAMEDYQQAVYALREAKEIANLLGNPDLIFNVQLLEATIWWKNGDGEKAKKMLNRLIKGPIEAEKRAALLFLQYSINQDPHTKKEALHLYRSLYHATPKFLYRQRLQLLENEI
ncbi:MAG: tetratricopeptide repeat protein, partial [Phaeodactylibacter sp.]|nr:tetratricopeptide repeat protein [Phaeodactylibacter sp.]